MIRKSVIFIVAAVVVFAGSSSLRAQTREGILVRGHWLIEVRNPDGTLATKLEFDNALTPSGGNLLGQLLAKQLSVGWWQVNLFGADNGIEGVEGIEEVPEGAGWVDHPGWYYNLKSSAGAAGLVLEGHVAAARSYAVTRVKTTITTCPPGTLPGNCHSEGADFSGTQLPSPLPIQAGQFIQVKVIISFAAAPHQTGF